MKLPGKYSRASVRYTWECARCKVAETHRLLFRAGEEVPLFAEVPTGWKLVDGILFCPLHRVRTFVDDKLLGSEGQQ